jgi:hypothetical protein
MVELPRPGITDAKRNVVSLGSQSAAHFSSKSALETLHPRKIVNTTMWHNLVWIGGIWLVTLVFAWVICHWRGYNVAA